MGHVQSVKDILDSIEQLWKNLEVTILFSGAISQLNTLHIQSNDKTYFRFE